MHWVVSVRSNAIWTLQRIWETDGQSSAGTTVVALFSLSG